MINCGMEVMPYFFENSVSFCTTIFKCPAPSLNEFRKFVWMFHSRIRIFPFTDFNVQTCTIILYLFCTILCRCLNILREEVVQNSGIWVQYGTKWVRNYGIGLIVEIRNGGAASSQPLQTYYSNILEMWWGEVVQNSG